ncbi:MAG: hypothetical protein C5B59_04850 [Bacteroidetes bacterium]|nr:MAG: hypothetical protein C5B59_04850 [Bacteroidota bacterium]
MLLVHECHDWAHFLFARIICGCWGTKGFDTWTVCASCQALPRFQPYLYFVGPLITYIIIWIGFGQLNPKNRPTKRSLGFALVFAGIPFVRILAAAVGGGDETYGLRLLFQHADGSNRHTIAITGLVLVLLLTILPLLRAFLFLPSWIQKLLLFPVFLVAPMYLDHWIMQGMNQVLAMGFLKQEFMPGVPFLMILWIFLLVEILILTRKNLLSLLDNLD